MRLSDEHLLESTELSGRTKSALHGAGLFTLGQLRYVGDNVDKLPRVGSKAMTEIKRLLNFADSEPDLLNTPELRRERLVDSVTSGGAILADIQRDLVHVALNGRASLDKKEHMERKLGALMNVISQLPTLGDN